jgi:hypothetical protein
LYGCETWSVTLREQHRLRVFENRVLRGIFGPKGDEVTGEWNKFTMGNFAVRALTIISSVLELVHSLWCVMCAQAERRRHLSLELLLHGKTG